ncbi:MAG: precorrin-3B synthase [Xanthobacteraceae bacterium]|jgi:precorrin-3B synthase
MTDPVLASPQRRGACPGLSVPMATGDGLLVRLLPIGTIALDAFAGLCAAARRHGNGIIEVTSRGSIQIRGLSAASAPCFASAISALGIAAGDGIPVLTDQLAGLALDDIIDAAALAADLRVALAQGSLAQRLSAKISVTIDGGGALNLDDVAGDVRLRAETVNGTAAFCTSVGGDGRSAAPLGCIAGRDTVEFVTRLLEIIARRERHTRARDIVAAEGIAAFRPAVEDLLVAFAGSRLRENARKEPIGVHPLRDGTFAHGVGLAFSHADAMSLQRLAEAAKAAGARGMRAAPGRTLMIIGLTQQTVSSFAAAAEALGFIVRADDPRRHVIACAGAPICASADIAARALAPQIAAAAAPHLDGAFKIHISGCAKGCALPAPAALTVVGTASGCALVANGSTRDAPFKIVTTNELPAAIAEIARRHKHEDENV